MQQVPFSFIRQVGASLVIPSDISNLKFWVKSDAGVLDTAGGSISDGEEVGTWDDQSGNGLHLTRNIAVADGPTYDDTTYSYPVLTSGDTVTQVMGRTTGDFQDPNMCITLIFMLHETGTAVNDYLFSTYSIGSGLEYMICKSISAGTSATFYYKNNSAYSITFNFDTPYIMQINCDNTGGTIEGYLNGATAFSNIYANTAADGFVLFNNRGQTVSPAMSIMECFIHGKHLTAGELSDMQDYANSRFGI